MALGDFYPTTDANKAFFLDNYMTNLALVGVTVGIDAATQTATGTVRTNFKNAQADKLAKKSLAQAAVKEPASPSTRPPRIFIRAQVRRIKAHAAYTPAIGRQLGIEVAAAGPATATVGGGPRPNLEATSVVNGEVELAFEKQGYDGVEIECQRGTETSYTFLARDTQAPYVDNRPSLTDAPETRRYRARFLKVDAPTGEFSDVLVVTVPGKG